MWQPGRLLPVTPLNIRDAKKFVFTLPTTGGQRSPVCLFGCPSVDSFSCLAVHPSACPSVYLTIHPSICPSFCLSIHHFSVHLSVRPFVFAIRLSIHSSVYLSTCLPVLLTTSPSWFINTSVYASVCSSVGPSIHLTLCVCPHLSARLSAVCLSPSVCLFSNQHQPPLSMLLRCCLSFRHQHRQRPAGRFGAAAGLPD